MKSVFQFLLGLATSLAVSAAIAIFAFRPSPSDKPTRLSAAAPQRRPLASEVPPGAPIFLDGLISVPPLLRNVLSVKADAVISLVANSELPGSEGENVLIHAGDLVLTSFPNRFHARLNPEFLRSLGERRQFTLNLMARICFDRQPGTEPCLATSRHRMAGTMRVPINLDDARPGTKGILSLTVPNLIISKYVIPVNEESCALREGYLEGRVRPTAGFLKAMPPGQKLLLIAVPYGFRHPPAPFFGPRYAPLPPEQAAKLPELGVSWSPLSLEAGGETRFRLPASPAFRDAHFDLYVQACRAGEAEPACLRNAFPVYWSANSKTDNVERFQLVAEAFEVLRCGQADHLFYLHRWQPDSARASEISVHVSNPPELIEGTDLLPE